jgi:hypothetical protein
MAAPHYREYHLEEHISDWLTTSRQCARRYVGPSARGARPRLLQRVLGRSRMREGSTATPAQSVPRLPADGRGTQGAQGSERAAKPSVGGKILPPQPPARTTEGMEERGHLYAPPFPRFGMVDTRPQDPHLGPASLCLQASGDLASTDMTMEPQPSSSAGNWWFRVSSRTAQH